VWCSVVQCVAVCCSVLHCVAVCCSVSYSKNRQELQCVAVRVSCSVLQWFESTNQIVDSLLHDVYSSVSCVGCVVLCVACCVLCVVCCDTWILAL